MQFSTGVLSAEGIPLTFSINEPDGLPSEDIRELISLSSFPPTRCRPSRFSNDRFSIRGSADIHAINPHLFTIWSTTRGVYCDSRPAAGRFAAGCPLTRGGFIAWISSDYFPEFRIPKDAFLRLSRRRRTFVQFSKSYR